MAFARPTLTELVERIQLDFVSRLALVTPVLRRSLVYVLSRVVAGAAHLMHGHLEFLSKQLFPDQSDSEYLLRQAALFGLAIQEAQYAAGNLTLTGTNGSVVDIGAVLQRSDGVQYETVEAATIAGGTATVPVLAVLAGAAGNCDAGTAVAFASPVAGVNASAVVAAGGLVGGSDQEDLESLRSRLLERMRFPPHGGAAADYIAWAKETPGVTRAWVYPLEGGPGTVTVRFVRDDDPATIIPDAGEVGTVQAYINERAPVTAIVTVAAPTAAPLNYTINITPDTSAARAAVLAELADFHRRDARPGGTILLSQIRVAIGVAEGVSDFTVVAPTGDVSHSTGLIATLGTVTWA